MRFLSVQYIQKVGPEVRLRPYVGLSLNALENLCSETKFNLVTRIGNGYKTCDKMFELWIAQQYGLLDLKLASVKECYEKEKSLENNVLPELPALQTAGKGRKEKHK